MIADTSGRLHTNINLMKELEKVGLFSLSLSLSLAPFLCGRLTDQEISTLQKELHEAKESHASCQIVIADLRQELHMKTREAESLREETTKLKSNESNLLTHRDDEAVSHVCVRLASTDTMHVCTAQTVDAGHLHQSTSCVQSMRILKLQTCAEEMEAGSRGLAEQQL